MKQILLAALLNLSIVVAAIWMGEHENGPRGLALGALAAVVLSLLSASLMWWSSRRRAIAIGAMSLVLFTLPWRVAASESSLAFNECVADGERVREALGRYQAEHHQFPASLAELSVHLPGQLLFPPHVLNYERTSTGYTLSYSDWLVTHEASDRQAFLAGK